MSRCVGESKTVYRIGENEFAILMDDVSQRNEIAQFAQQIVYTLITPYFPNQEQVRVQVGSGIAFYPEHGSSPEELLSAADKSLYGCHRSLSDSYRFYSPIMAAIDAERRWLETNLKYALNRNELQIYYQPQINVTTGRIVGLEALLHWQHPKRGGIPAKTFIPVAEEMGLIVPINEWVLQTACGMAQGWQALSRVPLQMTVNLSAGEFLPGFLAATVKAVLQHTCLDPKLLVLELSETCLMDNIDVAIAILQEIKAMGVTISVDEFGTSYSWLKHLRSLPIDYLKIDRSFVSQVTENRKDAGIVKIITDLAKELKIEVIAEGVETYEQLSFLDRQRCYLIQGNFYSPPLPAKAIDRLLAEDKRFDEVPLPRRAE